MWVKSGRVGTLRDRIRPSILTLSKPLCSLAAPG
jgi:hypothetical protein